MEEFYTKKEIRDIICAKRAQEFRNILFEKFIFPAIRKGQWYVELDVTDETKSWELEEMTRLRAKGYFVKREGDKVEICWRTPMTNIDDEEDNNDDGVKHYDAVEAYNETLRHHTIYMDFCKKHIRQSLTEDTYLKEIFLGEIPKEVEDEIERQGFTLRHGESKNPWTYVKEQGAYFVVPSVD